MILYLRQKDGGFLVGDTETGRTAYAYPSSEASDQAKKNPRRTAESMMAFENGWYDKYVGFPADERNAERIDLLMHAGYGPGATGVHCA